jgi:hypothetical protein
MSYDYDLIAHTCSSQEILRVLKEKDAEIERLRGAGQAISEQLKIAVREKQELKAELQNSGVQCVGRYRQRIAELEGLITELCDALDAYTPDAEGGYRKAKELIQRAREATRHE